mmetsp:Transcript_37836/g.48993  ORF Transcript_37836/g.48993 Transcript_37836/m.48993 type:complete len:98 (+) Transcript_37836:156-449(+)
MDWNDKELVIDCIKKSKNGYNLKYASLELRNDVEVVIAAVEEDGGALQCADLTGILRGNREVALAACLQDGESLEYVAFDLRGNSEIVIAGKLSMHI